MNVMYAAYLDNEDKKEEKAIQYLVKDEVGALANTLEVISVSSFKLTFRRVLIAMVLLVQSMDSKGNGDQYLWCKS